MTAERGAGERATVGTSSNGDHTRTDARLLDLPSAESTWRDVSDDGDGVDDTDGADDVELHVVAAGEERDPLVVLLHGFPDFWYGWDRQVPALVEAGYRVLVPDQRGYNLSDRPDGLDAYRTGRLSGDVAALIESEGRESAHVVGHDFGAGVAWDLALRRPEYVERLGIVNAPHPTVMERTLRSNPRQLLRSWYVLYFQVPLLPEWGLGRNDAAGMISALRSSSNPGAFTDEDLDRYRSVWRREGAIRPAVDWYRALVRRRDDPPRERVTAPTLVVWGEEDFALVPEMARESTHFCRDAKLVLFPAASHWVHREESERVTQYLLDHLGD